MITFLDYYVSKDIEYSLSLEEIDQLTAREKSFLSSSMKENGSKSRRNDGSQQLCTTHNEKPNQKEKRIKMKKLKPSI